MSIPRAETRLAPALGEWAAAEEPLLQVRGLTVAFGGKSVVQGIDFTIAARSGSHFATATTMP